MKIIVIDEAQKMIVGEIASTSMMPVVGVNIRFATPVNRLYEKPQIKLCKVKEIEIDYVSGAVIVSV